MSLVELEPCSHCSVSVNQMNAQSPPPAVRHHLPNERMSITHKFTIGAHEGYITVGLCEVPQRRNAHLPPNALLCPSTQLVRAAVLRENKLPQGNRER